MASSLKADFVSGFVVLLPLLVCLFLLRWVYGRIASFPLVEELPSQIPILSSVSPELSQVVFTLALLLVMLFAVGFLMRTAAGRVIEASIDAAINSLPGFRMIYNASKMAVETAVDNVEVQEPVKVILWDGHRFTGFRTGKRTPDGRSLVFVPTSPNVTSGVLLEVEEDDIIRTGESMEDALGRMISAGFGEQDHADSATVERFRSQSESGSDSGDSQSEQTPDSGDV